MAIYYPKCVVQVDVILYDYGDTSQKSEFHLIVAPVHCSVNINSYNLADTFSVTVRFEDLPFDPRLIRSLRATVYMLDLKRLRNISAKDLKDNADKIIITGFADNHTIRLEQTERTVSFDGRDYTALFIDSTWDNANLEDDKGKRTRQINKQRPVKDIIEDLISNLPAAAGIEVLDMSGQAVKNLARSIPEYDLTNGRKSSEGKDYYTEPNRTYWDVIVSLCEAAALICYIELDKLILTTPRILFRSGGIQGKKTLQFIYGFNLMGLEFYRNLGKKKRFNFLFRGFDVRTGKKITVSIPRDANKDWADSMNIDKAVVKIKELDHQGIARERVAPAYTFPLPPNITKEDAIEIGQKVFEEYVRQQLEGSCETREMRVNDTDNIEFDVTKIRMGTPILIEIANEDVKNIMRRSPDGTKISDSQRIAYLVRRGYPPRVAQELIKAVAKGTGKLRPLFYVREAQFEMGNDGFSLRIGFINYIQVSDVIQGKLLSG